jgi:hypothetical protein
LSASQVQDTEKEGAICMTRTLLDKELEEKREAERELLTPALVLSSVNT